MLRPTRAFALLVLAFLTLVSLCAALPTSTSSDKNDRRLISIPSNSWTCKFFGQCPKPASTSTAPAAPKSTAQTRVVAAGNTARPTPMAVWTIPFLPFLGPPKTTTFTTTKTGTVTVTTSKTTTASVTSVATATKTISGSTTQFTSITVVPSVTVVPVTTVLTTTQAVPVVSTVTAVVPSTTTVATTIISNIVTTATVVVPVSVTTTTAAATPTLAPTSDPTTPDQQAVVDAHNSYRSKHGVQPLTWNATLAKFAQAQSDRCVWGHSGGPYGENGASGVGFNLTMASAATLWYNEIQNYNFSQPGFSEATGHFTQLIWKSSSTIGCAISQCTPAQLGFTWTGNDPAWNVWCEYSNLPGNIIGQFDTQVLPPLGVPLVNGVVSSLLSTSRSLTAPLTGRAKVRVDREDI